MKRKIRNIMVILIFTGWAVCAGNREVIPLEKNGTEEVLSHECLKNNLAEKYSFSSLTITEGRYREYRDNPPMIDIDICYPQLHGMQDSRKEERINALIAEDAIRLLRNNPVYTRFQEGSYPYEKKYLLPEPVFREDSIRQQETALYPLRTVYRGTHTGQRAFQRIHCNGYRPGTGKDSNAAGCGG
jgi:hypothetical protein